MSAFALPMPPACLTARLRRPTERSATTPEDRDQESGIRTAAGETLQNAGDLPIFGAPTLCHIASEGVQIAGIKGPHLHFIRRTDRHRQQRMEVGTRLTPLA